MLWNLKRGLNTAYIRNEYRRSLRSTIACWGRFVGGRVYFRFPVKDGGKPSITACGGKPGLQSAGTAPDTPPCHSRSLLSGNPPLVGLMDCEYGFPLKDCGNDRIGVCGNSGIGLSGMKTPFCPTTQTVQALKARNRLLSRFFKRAARFLWCRPLDTARSMLAVASRYAPAGFLAVFAAYQFQEFLDRRAQG